MTSESIAPFSSIPDQRRAAETAPHPATEEARHDALQAVGTILALVEAGTLTVEDPHKTRTRLEQIQGEVLTLRSLLRHDLLGASRPVHGVVDAAAETVRLVGAATVGWTGTVGVFADTSARAAVTSGGLRRILCNVLRNAMRAAGPEGQIRVTVSQSGGKVQIEVEDDGPGFGTLPVRHGIGLRSVRRLVHHAGGWVEVGGPGRLGGASVHILLPAADREAAS